MLKVKHSDYIVFVLALWCFVFTSIGDDNTPRDFAHDHILVKFKPSIIDKIKASTTYHILKELLDSLYHLPPGGELVEPAINQVLREKYPP